MVSFKDIIDHNDLGNISLLYLFCVNKQQESFKATSVKCKHASGKTLTISTHNDILYDTECKRPLICLTFILDVKEGPSMDQKSSKNDVTKEQNVTLN